MACLPAFLRLISCLNPRKRQSPPPEIELLSSFEIEEESPQSLDAILLHHRRFHRFSQRLRFGIEGGPPPSRHAILLARHRFNQGLEFASLQRRIKSLPGEIQNKILLHVIENHLSVGEVWLTPLNYDASRFRLARSFAQPEIYRGLNTYWLEVAWNTFYESNTIRLSWMYWTLALMWPKPHWPASRWPDLGLLRDPRSVTVLDIELRMRSDNNKFCVKRAPCYTPRNRQVKLCLETTDCYTPPELRIGQLFKDVGLLHDYYVIDFAFSRTINQVCIYLIWPERWDSAEGGDGTV